MDNERVKAICDSGFSIPDKYNLRLCEAMSTQESTKAALGSFFLHFEQQKELLRNEYEQKISELENRKNKFMQQTREKEQEFHTVFDTIRGLFVPDDEDKNNYKYVPEIRKFIDCSSLSSEEYPKFLQAIRESQDAVSV